LTLTPARVHNVAVRRWLLLAAVFSLTVWASLALAPSSSETTTDAVTVAVVADVPTPGTTGDPNARWEVAHRPGVPLPESGWKLSPPHADLAAARSGVVCTTTDDTVNRALPSRSVPTSLLHIPLLI
jgi:hypothetical protein